MEEGEQRREKGKNEGEEIGKRREGKGKGKSG